MCGDGIEPTNTCSADRTITILAPAQVNMRLGLFIPAVLPLPENQVCQSHYGGKVLIYLRAEFTGDVRGFRGFSITGAIRTMCPSITGPSRSLYVDVVFHIIATPPPPNFPSICLSVLPGTFLPHLSICAGYFSHASLLWSIYHFHPYLYIYMDTGHNVASYVQRQRLDVSCRHHILFPTIYGPTLFPIMCEYQKE